MKKLTTFGITLLFISILFSCGSTKSSVTPTIKKGNWQFSRVKMKEKYSDISGNIKLKVLEGGKLKENALIKLNINIDKLDPKVGNFKVIGYENSEIVHIWPIKNKKTGKAGSFSLFKKEIKVKGKKIKAMLILGRNDKKIIFYLY